MTQIVATLAGETRLRAEVLAWEDARIDAAAKKLRVAAPPAGATARRREEWLRIKRDLGDDELRRRLAGDVRIADRLAILQARVSARRRHCVAELLVPGASAGRFTEWFEHITFSDDRDAMERSCPDHFLLRMNGGRQEVLETNGGSPFAALFAIDYDDASTLTTPVDHAFSHRLDGVARASNGAPVGGVRHQFRDTDEGLHARLCVEFPLPMLGRVVRGHRWHLACEFSNWIEASLTAS